MRRSERSRHPFFEWTVFALAVVLAGILLFHGARRLLLRRAADGPPRVTAPLAPQVPGPAAEAGPSTETAVTALPPVRLTSMGGGKRWKTDVPAPHSSSEKK